MSSSWGGRPVRHAVLTFLALCLALSLAAVVPTAGAAQIPGLPGAPGESPDPEPPADGPTDQEMANDQPQTPKRCGKPPVTRCFLTSFGKQAPQLVLWGDSHMWMMIPAVIKAARAKKVNVVLFFLGGCVPALPDMELYAGNDCAELSMTTLRHVQQLEAKGHPYRLMLGSYWGANLNRVKWYEDPARGPILKERRVYTQAYTRPLFQWLGKKGIPTDVSYQGPASVPPRDCGKGTWPFWCPVPRAHAYYKEAYIRKWLAARMRHLPKGARLVDYSSGICTKRSCAGVIDGVHTWFDPYHVSASMAARMTGFYRPSVRAATRGR